jgi:hypothetical protein
LNLGALKNMTNEQYDEFRKTNSLGSFLNTPFAQAIQ